MKVYFDTNVLVAAFRTDHVHHDRSYAAVDAIYQGDLEGYVSGHSLAELYSVLTRTPFTTRVQPEDLPVLVAQSILPYFRVVEVSTSSHLAAIDVCAKAGRKGGRIHDAVHIEAALQAACDAIYTWNLDDFQSFAPAITIVAPPAPGF